MKTYRIVLIAIICTLAGGGIIQPVYGQMCPNSIVLNGNFTQGIVPGAMPNQGSVNNWTASYGSPDVGAGTACPDIGFINMWGNQSVGEAIQQANLSIVAGMTYQISLCIRRNVESNRPYPIRFKVRASNVQLTSPTDPNGITIGVTGFEAAGNWTGVTLPAWTPLANYSIITVSAENQSSFGHGDSVTYGGIDDVCITATGACCLPDGSCTEVNGESACDALGGFYWGDGTDCAPNPCVGDLLVCKYNDQNRNGVRDPGEVGVPNVLVRAIGPVPSIITYNGVTDANGCFNFSQLPVGTFRVFEDVPSDMVQTAPGSVFFTVNTLAGAGVIAGDFGNIDTTCEKVRVVDTCLAGIRDNFGTADGPELAAPSTALCTQLQNCSSGPRDDCNPAVPDNCSEFDCPGTDRCFGHTFTGCWDPNCLVIQATLNLRVRSSIALSSNDGLNLYQNGNLIWSIPFSTLGILPGVLNISLDLANLPPNTLGVTNVLAALQDGDLDVIIHDDTEVDFIELIVMTCCDCIPPPADMVAWWTLDEQTGTTADDIAGMTNPLATVNNVGTHQNSPTPIPTGTGPGDGKIDGALRFDGVNDYVSVAPDPELDFCCGDLTIDAWVRLADPSDTRSIVDKRSATPVGYTLYIKNGRLGFQMADAAGYSNYETGILTWDPAVWYQVAVTIDRSGSGILYVDGNSVLTFTPRTGVITNNAPLWIGRHHWNNSGAFNSYWDGDIDEVELFNRALSPTEIASLCNPAGKCKPCCLCPFPGDLDGNGFIDAMDLATIINIVFFGASDVQDPCCPITRGDFNGDGFTDAIDLSAYIDYIFFGGPPPVNPCKP